MRTEFAIAEVMPGKLNALVKNIMRQTGETNPDEAVRLINSGEWIVSKPTPSFTTWRTIKLGTGLRTADEFRKDITDKNYHIGNQGNDILDNPAFTTSETEVKVELIAPTVAELGFKRGAKRADIYQRAISLGLEICPAEVGPQLLLQYRGKPMKEWLLIGMEPVADSNSHHVIFDIGYHESILWLDGYTGEAGYFWNGYYRFIFILRKWY